MQIYAVAQGLERHARMPLAEAVAATGREFGDPRLSAALTLHERGAGVEVAALAHAPAHAGRRRYHARLGSAVVLFDGLPVAIDGAFAAADARHLAERWEAAVPDGVTGIFSAVRADLATGDVQCMTDALGLSRVYLARRGGGWALSTSITVLRRLLGLSDPDLVALSTLMTLGWAVGGRTLVDGIAALPGGHLHRWRGGRTESAGYAGTARLARDRARPALPELAERMVTATRAASRVADEPLACGVTAGRDSRVLMALARAAGADARYHTVHLPGADEDVERGRELAAAVGAEHEVWAPAVASDPDAWRGQTARFMAQLEGAASIGSISEWLDHQRPRPALGVRLWGMGGEVGRAAIGLGTAVVANAWGIRRALRPQVAVIRHKVQDGGGLVHPAAVARTRSYLDAFVAQRLAEGWPTSEVAEAYYAFERVPHLFHAGTRRSAAAVDAYSPYASRDFLQYAFACTPGERYVEAPHHRLLAAFDRGLLEGAWERPWRSQRHRLAPVMVLHEAARLQARRAAAAVPSLGPGAARAAPAPFGHQWLEGGVGTVLELVRARPSSPVWEVADRAAVTRLLEGPSERRSVQLEHLCRIATALWYFDAP